MVIRWRQQTGRWMKSCGWTNSVRLPWLKFQASLQRKILAVNVSANCLAICTCHGLRIALTFHAKLFISSLLFLFLRCAFLMGSWREWWWRAAMPVTALQEPKHIQKTSIQRLWWRWKDFPLHLFSTSFSAFTVDVLMASLQGFKIQVFTT